MKETKKKKKKPGTSVGVSGDGSISAFGAFFVYLITGLFLAVGFWVARNKYSVDLISDPAFTLRLLWSTEFPLIVIIYSSFRKNPEKCSYSKAVGRSILGLISGAFLNALGAIALGAPIGMQYLPKTIHWSFLMSVFTFVPGTAVFGASWTDWHRVFASMKPSGNIEYMIFVPAYGAIIGGWFGAWPMPLDWERPWQEWPICVCYGAVGGYIVGQTVSLSLIIFLRKHKNLKLA
uniref:Phosphatidylinositol-glycan biosynthesis class F protein n=1 Tax=Noccaea caerulescens TaxID=107243 RepID=A0A1J3IKU9_NOCCA